VPAETVLLVEDVVEPSRSGSHMDSFKKKLAVFAAICASVAAVGIAVAQSDPNPVTNQITLTPATATNPVGTTHTVTAHTFQSAPGNPDVDQPSKLVTFTVTGANAGATGTCNPADCKSSSPDALVSFTYTGATAGTDTITACFTDGNGTACTTATKTWEGVAPQPAIDLDPETDVNPVGTTHTVTATLTNAPASTPISFTVSAGPNAGAAGTCDPAGCADADNAVTFTYTGTVVGTDTITACATPAGGTEICDSATKEWVKGPSQ
jgi:hypothetical protein